MNIQPAAFVAVLEDLHTHSVYRPAYIADLLVRVGVPAAVAADGSGVLVGDECLPVVEPEWGDPGVSPHAVLSLACRLLIGHVPTSEMVGRGFWYRDVLAKLGAELEGRKMTRITQPAAERRFHQGLHYVMGMTDLGQKTADAAELLAVATVMGYLAAYAFPGGNLYDAKQRMLLAFGPLRSCMQVEPLVDRALRLAEVFRRPWTEPGDATGPTI